MNTNIEEIIKSNPTETNTIIDRLRSLQQAQRTSMNKGLPPSEFAQCESLIHAADAAIKIVEKTKTDSLTAAH